LTTDRERQRRRIAITAVILGAVALAIYLLMFVRYS
jgi:type VI protein secretion system component VasF